MPVWSIGWPVAWLDDSLPCLVVGEPPDEGGDDLPGRQWVLPLADAARMAWVISWGLRRLVLKNTALAVPVRTAFV